MLGPAKGNSTLCLTAVVPTGEASAIKAAEAIAVLQSSDRRMVVWKPARRMRIAEPPRLG